MPYPLMIFMPRLEWDSKRIPEPVPASLAIDSVIYPQGEGYRSMEKRVHRGMKKVFYLNNLDDNIMIVGHQAVNRMLLSYFLSRPKEEVPFIYMPQDRYYHIQIDPYKRIFELLPYTSSPR